MAQRTELNRPYGLKHEDDIVRDITELYAGAPVYKVYRAILNQTSTAAPVITVLENTLGVNFTPTRQGAGDYIFVSDGGDFHNGALKTQFFLGTTWAKSGEALVGIADRWSIYQNDFSFNPSDGMSNISIEIRVYA
jgi:hypothetical protein